MDVEAAFLARFANCGRRQRLAAVHIAAWKDPFPIAWIDRPSNEHDAAGQRPDDCAHIDLGIDVKDKAARPADKPFWFGRFQPPPLERAAAWRTEAIGLRVFVWVR